tara:strand:- start:1584 stop:2048 length:465 start_codon:yes stop_codon:yes gene_type:complete
VIDDYFMGVIFALFVLMSPFLAIIERLLVGLSGLLVVLILGFIILTCPIFFVAGIVLILASEATVMSGLYYIAFSVLCPIVLIPIFLHVSRLADSDELFESKLIVPFANVLIVFACLLLFGPSSTVFYGVLVAASILTFSDLVMNKAIADANNW